MANTELLPARLPASLPSRARSRGLPLVADLVALTKPRITAMVILTEAAGLWLAPGHASGRALGLSLIGTALIVGAANALNMWWECDVDARMERTRNRPLPAGRLSPDVALAFGLALAVVSAPMLFLVNLATGLLGLVALVSYVAVYTPLKRHTHLALLVGAVPGAMPPLMGWSTVTGSVGLGGFLLFGVLFSGRSPTSRRYPSSVRRTTGAPGCKSSACSTASAPRARPSRSMPSSSWRRLCSSRRSGSRVVTTKWQQRASEPCSSRSRFAA